MTIVTAKTAGAHYIATGHGAAQKTEAGRISIVRALEAILAIAPGLPERAFATNFLPFADEISLLAIGSLQFENTDHGLVISGSQPIVPGSAMHRTLVATLEKAVAAFGDPSGNPSLADSATVTTVASPLA